MFSKAWQHLRDHFVPNAGNNYTPHLIGHRSLSLYAGFLFSAKALAIVCLVLLPQNQALSSELSVQNVLNLTNYSRQSYGLPALANNQLLAAAAQAKAEDMLKNQYFAHTSPQGLTPWNFIQNAGYKYVVAGENLALNYYSAEGVSEAWMQSPEHRANILNKDFQDIGIGIVQGQYQGTNVVFVVEEFGSTISQPFMALPGSTNLQVQAAVQNLPGSLPMPAANSISNNPAPVLDGGQTKITNKAVFAISGSAVGEKSVYIIVNGQPQVSWPVSNGKFSGAIQMNQGNNTISAVAFNSAGQATKQSSAQQIILNTQAPKILGSTILPDNAAGPASYMVTVNIQGAPTKVLATVGNQSFFLQPAANGVWQGLVVAKSSDLQDAVSISAYDLAGNIAVDRVSVISSSLVNTYGFMAAPQHVFSVLGHSFSISYIDNLFWFVIAAVLIVLGMNLGIKKHIQHLDVIAEASGFIIVALVMLLI